MRELKKLFRSFAYLASILMTVSCQEPEIKVTPPNAEATFTRASNLGGYLFGMAALDGSADNIIDNASCLTVVLPIEVKFKGTPAVIRSQADLGAIIEAYRKNPYQKDLLNVDFPIKVKLRDHSEVMVGSKEELRLLAGDCSEQSLAEKVECVDFAYPITIATYELQSQRAATLTVRNDQQLYNLLRKLAAEDLVSIQFPVSLTTIDGETLVVEKNSALEDAIVASAVECDEKDEKFYYEELPTSMGSILLSLTDAPFPIGDIEQANVIISQIDVKTGEENDSVSFITLFEDEVAVDLLELTNGATSVLGQVDIPAGSYRFFRFYVKEASIVLKDERVFELKIPSGGESGVLVKPSNPIVIEDGKTTEFLFDFDLGRSFIPLGNPASPVGIIGFNFVPVIRATNLMESGTLSGKVTNEMNMPLEGVQLSVFSADTLHSTAFTGQNGTFTILGLLPGPYDVTAELDGYESEDALDISIVQDEETYLEISMNQP